MTLPKKVQPTPNVSMVQSHTQLTPMLARQWTEELCAAWDAIQPMEQPWRDLLGNRKTAAAALKNLNELARPAFAVTEDQRLALARMRLLLDALAIREPLDDDVLH